MGLVKHDDVPVLFPGKNTGLWFLQNLRSIFCEHLPQLSARLLHACQDSSSKVALSPNLTVSKTMYQNSLCHYLKHLPM